MKKNKALFLILGVLVALTIYYFYSTKETTIRKELKDFAVKDTASITKIFLADRNGNTITLERKLKSPWFLNGTDEPKPDFLRLLLEVIYKVEVRSPVAKAAYNNVIKRLATNGVKCEIYLNEKNVPEKTIYVGGQTEDDLGTFMMLENSSTPFITEIPGLNGYLTPRFSTSIDAWSQTILFRLMPKDLKSLSIRYANFPEKSFTITSTGGKYNVVSPVDNKPILKVDSVGIDNYLALYRNVFYESRIHEMSPSKKDSILLNPASIVVSLTKVSGETKEVSIYPLPISKSSLVQQDPKGNPLKYDVDRMYGYILPEKEFVILQHYTFDILLRQISDFDASVKKNKSGH